MPVLKEEKNKILDDILTGPLPSISDESDVTQGGVTINSEKPTEKQRDLAPILPTEQWSADNFWNGLNVSESARKAAPETPPQTKLNTNLSGNDEATSLSFIEQTVPVANLGDITGTEKDVSPEIIESQAASAQIISEAADQLPVDEISRLGAESSNMDVTEQNNAIIPGPAVEALVSKPLIATPPAIKEPATEAIDPVSGAKRLAGILDKKHFDVPSPEKPLGTLAKVNHDPRPPLWKPKVMERRAVTHWDIPIEMPSEADTAERPAIEESDSHEYTPIELAVYDESGVRIGEEGHAEEPHLSVGKVIAKIKGGSSAQAREELQSVRRIKFTNADTKPEIIPADDMESDRDMALPPEISVADSRTNAELNIPDGEGAMAGIGDPQRQQTKPEDDGSLTVDQAVPYTAATNVPEYQAPILTSPDNNILQGKSGSDAAHDNLIASIAQHKASPQPVQPLVPTPPTIDKPSTVVAETPAEGTAQAVATEASAHFANQEPADPQITIDSVELAADRNADLVPEIDLPPAQGIPTTTEATDTNEHSVEQTAEETAPFSLVDNKPEAQEEEQGKEQPNLRLLSSDETEEAVPIETTEISQDVNGEVVQEQTIGQGLLETNDQNTDTPTQYPARRKGILGWFGVRQDNNALDKISDPKSNHAAVLQRKHEARQQKTIKQSEAA